MKKLLYLTIAAIAIAACDKANYYVDADIDGKESFAADGEYAGSSEAPGEGNGEGQGGQPGVITAGEWNDLANWPFWAEIMSGQDYSKFNYYWGLNTKNRISCKVVDAAGQPVVGAKLELKSARGEIIWTSRSDNKGLANLWAGVFDKDPDEEQYQQPRTKAETASYSVTVNGVPQSGEPKITDWAATTVDDNVYTLSSTPTVGNQVDIAFIVDATGSMGDEIAFLKEDLMDILDKVGKKQTSRSIFTGTVFYRDVDDDYLTCYSEFTTDISSTVSFVKGQDAAGGGDWPEAVHTALEVTLTELQWHDNAYSKLAFMILDAPAHKGHQGVVESLQKSISQFSAKGIKIIPVFCSSYSKDCEFMCRQFAILTGGTYVFLTDDSQVGATHVIPTVGDYQVERLNDLIERLIDQYIS